MIHDLKCWPAPFAAVASGLKRHEVRVNDRPYKVGDTLHLMEWVPADHHGPGDEERFTGRSFVAEVTYITKGGTWGLPDKLCVMSIRLTFAFRGLP